MALRSPRSDLYSASLQRTDVTAGVQIVYADATENAISANPNSVNQLTAWIHVIAPPGASHLDWKDASGKLNSISIGAGVGAFYFATLPFGVASIEASSTAGWTVTAAFHPAP